MARILITGFCSIPSPGRPGVQLGHIIDGLHRQHQVDVLSVRAGEQAHVERVSGIRYLRVPLPDGDLAAQIEVFRRALRRQIEGADYDVVHFRDGWSGLTALEMQSSQAYATVFDLARSPMAEPILTDLATATELERAEQACVRRADLVLAPTEPSRQYLAGFTSAAKIHVVPPGVNVDRFDWEDLNVDRAPIVLYLGSLTPGRGVRVLLRAMLDVAAVSNAILVLAGPSSETFSESLEAAVTDLGLEGRVRLLGEVPHELAPAIIARATVCVAPGAAELSPKPTALFPTKILEYMACRRSVVAPARGTVKMLFRDGEECLMFSPGSPADLAEKILLLLRDTKLRTRIAKGGYELVRSNCTASGTRRSLRRAYNWLAEHDQFRDRLGQPEAGDPRLAPITELGLDLSVRPPSHADTSEEYVDESLVEREDLAVNSPPVDAEEVTRVEAIHPEESDDEDDTGNRSAIAGNLDTEAAFEGTDVFSVELPVIEDTGSIDLDANKPKTVVTAPLDDSLVAGELSPKPARPELAEPIAQREFDAASTGVVPPLSRARIPPAHKIGRSVPDLRFPSATQTPQDKTRVLAVSDIEEMSAPSDEPTGPARAGGPEEEDLGRTRVVVGAIPRPPKLPTRKPPAPPTPKASVSSSGGPRRPVEPDDAVDPSAKTRVVMAPLAPPKAQPRRTSSVPADSDPKSPTPDERG